MGSREEILDRIVRNTRNIYEYPDLSSLEQESVSYGDKLSVFCRSLEAAGGKAVTVQEGESIADIVRKEYPGARTVVSGPGLEEYGTASSEDYDNPCALDGTDVALVRGCFGVAENGAVWITDYGRFRALLFIAEALVIVIDRNDIVDNMHQAYSRQEMSRDRDFGTFISGPSKTADIEQALVFGAHGACSVTVILL